MYEAKAAGRDGYRVAAFAGTVVLQPGQTNWVIMAIGQGRSDEAARELAAAWREIGRAERALDETKRWWADTLSTLRIETNDPAAIDAIVRRAA